MAYEHSNPDSPDGDSMSRSESHPPRNPTNTRPSSATGKSDAVRLHRCSYCGTEFDRAKSEHMPFCSKRCQQIDLGMWLNESYGFPYEGDAKVDSFEFNSNDEDV